VIGREGCLPGNGGAFVEARTRVGVGFDTLGIDTHGSMGQHVPVLLHEVEGLRSQGRKDEEPHQKPQEGPPAVGSVMRTVTH